MQKLFSFGRLTLSANLRQWSTRFASEQHKRLGNKPPHLQAIKVCIPLSQCDGKQTYPVLWWPHPQVVCGRHGHTVGPSIVHHKSRPLHRLSDHALEAWTCHILSNLDCKAEPLLYQDVGNNQKEKDGQAPSRSTGSLRLQASPVNTRLECLRFPILSHIKKHVTAFQKARTDGSLASSNSLGV